MNRIASLLTLCTLLAFNSCSEDPQTTTTYTIQDIFPLSAGSFSVIQTQKYDTSDAVIRTDTVLVRIDSLVAYNGMQGYSTFYVDDYRVLFYKGDDLMSGDFISEVDEFMLRYPIPSGETYVSKDTTYSDSVRSRVTLRILSENEKVTVPAGTFDCIKYESIRMYGKPGVYDTTSLSYSYYAPHVGYVKQEEYRNYGGYTLYHQLTNQLLLHAN